MIVIKGDVSCIALEENFLRFIEVLEWCHSHPCILKRNKIIISITKGGVITEYDYELDMILELCAIYNFKANCRSCGKMSKSINTDEE